MLDKVKNIIYSINETSKILMNKFLKKATLLSDEAKRELMIDGLLNKISTKDIMDYLLTNRTEDVYIPQYYFREHIIDAVQQKLNATLSIIDAVGQVFDTTLSYKDAGHILKALNNQNVDWIGGNIKEQLKNIKILDFSDSYLTNIDFLSPLTPFLTNLECLSLRYISLRGITDITPLANFTSLKVLDLGGNNITDITLLASFTSLEVLDLENNNITDITPLASLKNLEWLNLAGNPIKDTTALIGLRGSGLKWLFLK